MYNSCRFSLFHAIKELEINKTWIKMASDRTHCEDTVKCILYRHFISIYWAALSLSIHHDNARLTESRIYNFSLRGRFLFNIKTHDSSSGLRQNLFNMNICTVLRFIRYTQIFHYRMKTILPDSWYRHIGWFPLSWCLTASEEAPEGGNVGELNVYQLRGCRNISSNK